LPRLGRLRAHRVAISRRRPRTTGRTTRLALGGTGVACPLGPRPVAALAGGRLLPPGPKGIQRRGVTEVIRPLRFGDDEVVRTLRPLENVERLSQFPPLASSPLSPRRATSHRDGQLQDAFENRSTRVGREAQRPPLFHPDQRLMAQSHRVRVHTAEEVHPGQLRLPATPIGKTSSLVGL
jgi:hypothetical protein